MFASLPASIFMIMLLKQKIYQDLTNLPSTINGLTFQNQKYYSTKYIYSGNDSIRLYPNLNPTAKSDSLLQRYAIDMSIRIFIFVFLHTLQEQKCFRIGEIVLLEVCI